MNQRRPAVKNAAYPRSRKQPRRPQDPGKRAFVTAVAGAGGKSTYIMRQAAALAFQGRKVAVTTTTHIFDPRLVFGLPMEKAGPDGTMSAGAIPGKAARDVPVPVVSYKGIDYFGTPAKDGKLGPVSDSDFRAICAGYDYVLVEADGSHRMPAKIPLPGEPVILPGTDRVVIVMGSHALGRLPETVCQHFSETPDAPLPQGTALTPEYLRRIARHYYMKPLSRLHPDISFEYVLSDLQSSGLDGDVHDVTFVLMASGFGRRFENGKNKLLERFEGRQLYQYALGHLADAADELTAAGLRVHIAVVTRYPEIMQGAACLDFSRQKDQADIRAVYNSRAEEGITASIRTGARMALGNDSDAAVFFAADMPFLSGSEIARYISEFLCSGKTYGCLAVRQGKEVVRTVPGAFRIRREDVLTHLLDLRGDKGAMKIISAYPWDTYYYYTDPRSVQDFDYRF